MSNVTALFKAPVQPHTAFDDFWAAYPLKKSKGFARAAWQRAIRKASPELIIAGAALYASTAEPPYIKHPATWLNGECWADQEPVPPPMLDQSEARLSVMAQSIARASKGNRFAAEWVKNNVTDEDRSAMRARGMIE
mgnify:CR=1 FL=1